MIPFLPTPHNDELLYSVLGRYHIWSCNFSPKDTVYDLFGKMSASAVIDLPNNLQKISEQLSKGTVNNPERLIHYHTLFSLYKPFLPKERVYELINKMKCGRDVHTTIGVMASSISSFKFLRFCPECFIEDCLKHGEPYWHRIHQVPGVEICPIHHMFILDTKIKTTSRQNKHVFTPLDFEMQVTNNMRKMVPERRFEHETAIAKAAYWLLNYDVPVLGLDELHNRYVYYCKQKNLVTAKGRIRQADLIDSFINFYGDRFLYKIGCPIERNTENWLTKLVRKPRTSAHPLKHILFMRFIGLTPEEFFKHDSEIHPFGKGPWICLNPASDHYKQEVINDCKVTRDSKTGDPSGTFSCSCGFIYTRRGPDKEDADKFRIGRIKEFGPIWTEKLISLRIKDNKGLRETARILKVDPKTIKNQLEKWSKEGKGSSPIIDYSNKQKCIYRNYWLETVRLNEGKSRTEIRKLAKAEFMWLYRHDRKWLDNNSPQKIARRKFKDNRVDWKKRDKDLSTEVMKIITKELSSFSKKPERLTVSMIGKKIGYLSLLQRHLNKLPITEKVLNEGIESTIDFQVRRVKYAANQIREREELIRRWKIVREAGLRPGYSSKVQKAIEEEISKDNILYN